VHRCHPIPIGAYCKGAQHHLVLGRYPVPRVRTLQNLWKYGLDDLCVITPQELSVHGSRICYRKVLNVVTSGTDRVPAFKPVFRKPALSYRRRVHADDQ
jgi:hypothetical protein